MTNDAVPDQHVRQRIVTLDLARVLRAWLEEYEADRPALAMSMEWGGERQFEGAFRHLCRITNYDPRRFWSILNGETKTTSLWMADRILTAINCEHMLRTGEIHVFEDISPQIGYGMSNEEWYAYLEERGYCV
jgi:hypothetical protein